jgi:hypothetical protein
MLKKIIVIVACSFVVFQSNAQSIVPKSSFNIELGLPSSMGNKSFKSMMQGLV